MILKLCLFIYSIVLLIGLVLVIELEPFTTWRSRFGDWIALILWPITIFLSLVVYALQKLKRIVEKRRISRFLRGVLK